MVTCCFAGHRLAPHFLLEEIIAAIEALVLATDEIEFLSGSMGDFDSLCEAAVREAKKAYPGKRIRLYRVLPSCQYIPSRENFQYQSSLFDDTIVCGASDGAYYKSMIGKRNRWMVEQSDYMIAYFVHEAGGAYTTFRYARKRNVKIIRIGQNLPSEVP